MPLDERKITIYTYMVKMGKKTITEIPVDYQTEVSNRLSQFNISELESISTIREDLAILEDVIFYLLDQVEILKGGTV